MNTNLLQTKKYLKINLALAVLMILVLTFGTFSPAGYNVAKADTCVGRTSHNVAYIDSLQVLKGGYFPTTTTGPTGSFLNYHFFKLPYYSVSLAALLPGGFCGSEGCDTVLLNVSSYGGLACDLNKLTTLQKADLVTFTSQGHKLIIYDSECTAQDYSWLPYPFTTVNPGPLGQTGTLEITEENTLSSSDPTSIYYIDAPLLASTTDAVGDMNVMITYDLSWFRDMKGINALAADGPVHTYAALPPGTLPTQEDTGLIIYNGLDLDYLTSSSVPSTTTGAYNLAKIWLQELQQPFSPSCLPGKYPVVLVDIDIKPNSPSNTIQLTSGGLIPVAVITNEKIDAGTIDPDTVLFADAPAQRWEMDDVDDDGDLDMVLYFKAKDLNLDETSTEASLTGKTVDNIPFKGTDTVRIP